MHLANSLYDILSMGLNYSWQYREWLQLQPYSPSPHDPLTLPLLRNPLPRTFNALLEFGISNYNRNWSSCGMRRWTDYWQITVDWERRREGGRNVGIGVWYDDNWRNKLESIFNHGDNAALLQVPEPQTKPRNVLQLRLRLPLRVQLRLPAVT